MARFDVHPNPDGFGYLLDCQADILSWLSTRFVVPLVPPEEAPRVAHLNPAFLIDDREYVMATQLAGAIPARALDDPVVSLADQHGTIMNALDMLLTGY